MTPREIIISNIECRCDDRIGFNFVNGENRLNDFVGAGCEHNLQIRRWEKDGVEYYTDIWGNVWHRIKNLSKAGEVCSPVIQDWQDLDRYELPDLANPEFYIDARRLGASDTECFRLGYMPGWPFAICRYMRKMEIYFMDLLVNRAEVDILHDRVTSLLERIIDRFGEAGLDGIIFCEDLGTQDRLLMSPQMWLQIFRPLYERLTSRAHQYGLKVIEHSCGFNWELIDALCEAGIDCLQFDQPMLYELPALAEKLKKHRVGLYSPCDIQQVLPTGNRELIERETARLINTFRGGFIAKNYNDLPGIGVKPEWDQWAYETFVRVGRSGK